MEIKISSQFASDLKMLKDTSLYPKVKSVLQDLKEMENLESVPYFKPIKGNDKAFKMAIGFYFLLLFRSESEVYTLMRCLPRDVVMKFQIQ